MENKLLRVAIYARVSTQDQSTEMQIAELNAFALSRGWTVVRVFEETATGTAITKRAMLRELMSMAQQRQIDAVLAWRLDRFARSLKDLVNLLSQLQEVGVQFISLKDSIDLTTAQGRFMAQILGSFAELEASLIKERVRAGLKNARAKGVILGRKPSIDLVRARYLRSRGESFARIAQVLNCSRGGVHKALKADVI